MIMLKMTQGYILSQYYLNTYYHIMSIRTIAVTDETSAKTENDSVVEVGDMDGTG